MNTLPKPDFTTTTTTTTITDAEKPPNAPDRVRFIPDYTANNAIYNAIDDDGNAFNLPPGEMIANQGGARLEKPVRRKLF